MIKNKGFIGIGLILAIILGIIVIGGGAYYLGKSSSKEEQGNQLNYSCPKKSLTNPSLYPATTFLSDQYLELITPKAGDLYHVGDTMNIQWKDCNITSNGIRIYLLDNRHYSESRDSELIIKDFIPMSQGINDYKFTISSSDNPYFSDGKLNGQNTYSVMITDGSVGGGSGHGASSDTFSILP